MNKAKNYNSRQLDELFSGFDQHEAELVEMRMLIAARIDEGIKAKKWSKKQFAEKMGKKPSEISKWLSGTHNFTSDTLHEIGKKLCIRLINVESEKIFSDFQFQQLFQTARAFTSIESCSQIEVSQKTTSKFQQSLIKEMEANLA